MTLRLITAAASTGVTLAEAKSHCRVDSSDDDTLIQAYINAATAHAEKRTGVAMVAQTWEEVLDTFPDGAIELGIGPLVSVTSVKYDDADGVEQTVSASDYQVDTVSLTPRVVPVDAWPATAETINAVRVRFVAGTGTPHDVKEAVLLLVGHWYANREASVVDASTAELPFAVDALLSLHERKFC